MFDVFCTNIILVQQYNMLIVVFGADCDHVGVIYECPQGTYAIGCRAPLQNNFIYTKHRQQRYL